jgi:hypothetical protein
MIGRRCSATAAVVVVTAALLVGCAAESAADACARGPLFASSRERAERAVTELDRTTTVELEESVAAIVDQVLLLREVSPRSLRDPLGIMLAAYGQLVVALDDVSWDPQAAMADGAVARARAAFAETSVSQAADTVAEFFADQCEIALGESNPLFAVTGTTLPLPLPSEEPSLDAAEDTTVTPSELQAVGFLIGETYGVALVATEAECVARILGTNFNNQTDVDVNNEQYFALVTETFVSCGVTTPPTTTPDN